MKATILIVTALLAISGTSADILPTSNWFQPASNWFKITPTSFNDVVTATTGFVQLYTKQVFLIQNDLETANQGLEGPVFALADFLTAFIAKSPFSFLAPLAGSLKLTLIELEIGLKTLYDAIVAALAALLKCLEGSIANLLQYLLNFSSLPNFPEHIGHIQIIIVNFFNCFGAIFKNGVTELIGYWNTYYLAVQAFSAQASLLMKNPSLQLVSVTISSSLEHL